MFLIILCFLIVMYSCCYVWLFLCYVLLLCILVVMYSYCYVFLLLCILIVMSRIITVMYSYCYVMYYCYVFLLLYHVFLLLCILIVMLCILIVMYSFVMFTYSYCMFCSGYIASLCCTRTYCVLFVCKLCTVLLPPGGYPTAVNKYHIICIISYIIYHIIRQYNNCFLTFMGPCIVIIF